MRIIVCNVQMFSNDQMIYVYDLEKKQTVFVQKADISNLSDIICALANQHGATEVRLSGTNQYSLQLVDETKTTYALKYNSNILNVEVM